MASNLPGWPGADTAYARAYVVLRHMAMSGHVDAVRKGSRVVRCIPSTEMESFIDALNRGDEESIKAVNHGYRETWLQPAATYAGLPSE